MPAKPRGSARCLPGPYERNLVRKGRVGLGATVLSKIQHMGGTLLDSTPQKPKLGLAQSPD